MFYNIYSYFAPWGRSFLERCRRGRLESPQLRFARWWLTKGCVQRTRLRYRAYFYWTPSRARTGSQSATPPGSSMLSGLVIPWVFNPRLTMLQPSGLYISRVSTRRSPLERVIRPVNRGLKTHGITQFPPPCTTREGSYFLLRLNVLRWLIITCFALLLWVVFCL